MEIRWIKLILDTSNNRLPDKIFKVKFLILMCKDHLELIFPINLHDNKLKIKGIRLKEQQVLAKCKKKTNTKSQSLQLMR